MKGEKEGKGIQRRVDFSFSFKFWGNVERLVLLFWRDTKLLAGEADHITVLVLPVVKHVERGSVTKQIPLSRPDL